MSKLKIAVFSSLFLAVAMTTLFSGHIAHAFSTLVASTANLVPPQNSSTGADFAAVNQAAKNYAGSPSAVAAHDLVKDAYNLVSLIELSETEKENIFNQVASAHLNGTSNIQNSSVAAVYNSLATDAGAPAYAYVDETQVLVVRTYLNRLMPDLISLQGGMNDAEAFIVFTALISQKLDNESFMVEQAVFESTYRNLNETSIPGRPELQGLSAIQEESAKPDEMLSYLETYARSKKVRSASTVLSQLGIN